MLSVCHEYVLIVRQNDLSQTGVIRFVKLGSTVTQNALVIVFLDDLKTTCFSKGTSDVIGTLFSGFPLPGSDKPPYSRNLVMVFQLLETDHSFVLKLTILSS